MSARGVMPLAALKVFYEKENEVKLDVKWHFGRRARKSRLAEVKIVPENFPRGISGTTLNKRHKTTRPWRIEDAVHLGGHL